MIKIFITENENKKKKYLKIKGRKKQPMRANTDPQQHLAFVFKFFIFDKKSGVFVFKFL
jgi:hypothetical protein